MHTSGRKHRRDFFAKHDLLNIHVLVHVVRTIPLAPALSCKKIAPYFKWKEEEEEAESKDLRIQIGRTSAHEGKSPLCVQLAKKQFEYTH